MVLVRLVFAGCFVADFLGTTVGAAGAGADVFVLFVHEATGDVDDGAGDAMVGEVALNLKVAIGPFAIGGVGAKDDHRDSGDCDDDERDDEGDTPGDMRGKILFMDERVEDGGHEEVGYAPTGVSEASCERVGCADDVFIEEASRPDLAWNETATKNANEEPQS